MASQPASGDQAQRTDRLQHALTAALGPARRITTNLTRLSGGTKKGVYRALLDDRPVIIYTWDDAESYWPATDRAAIEDPSDPFADASSAELFTASYQCLRSLGIRTPELYQLNTSRTALPADIAVVEDIQGGSLQEYMQCHPADADRITAELGEMLRAMHACCRPRYGKVAYIDTDAPQDLRPEQIVLERALADLNHAAGQIDQLRIAHEQLAGALWAMAAAIAPRTEYALIHGELGPEHVLVDARSHPVIIDIEGLMFFDVEWEHAYLRFRYDEHYRHLREKGLDDARLRFYTLCLHLSLCAGPLRLLEGDFPDRETMLSIVGYNTARALEFVG